MSHPDNLTLQDALERARSLGTDAHILRKGRYQEARKRALMRTHIAACVGFVVVAVLSIVCGGEPRIGLALLMVLMLTWFGGVIMEDGRNLTPLAQTDYCDKALALVEQSPSARQLRDAILAQGRQLYVDDYFSMVRLVIADEHRVACSELADKQRKACARLHQVSA